MGMQTRCNLCFKHEAIMVIMTCGLLLSDADALTFFFVCNCFLLLGGQKSRVAFAKITFKKPHIILLDEPSNHLVSHYRSPPLFSAHFFVAVKHVGRC
jgi:ABC-type uncharacterized transport system YnjBCD ATPase subunit